MPVLSAIVTQSSYLF